MQSVHWVSLLKKLPPDAHNQLSVVTLGGTEVLIQSIQTLEGEFLVFKGRLAASQDTGRLFFIPYDQIDYIGFVRAVAEDEYRAWFGDSGVASANGTAEKPAETNGTPRPLAPNRAALLERVRARATTPGISPLQP